MKKWNIKKILIIISIIIICFGMIAGLSISKELIDTLPNGKTYVDGSDFSGLVQIGGTIGSIIMGIAIVIYSIVIDIIIWLIYGLVLIIIKIVKKINGKEVD